jgi:chemotaxis signal transduction protein
MSLDSTALISVVVLQNRMGVLNREIGPCSEPCVLCTHGGNELTGINVESVTDITEAEDRQPTTIPVVKTEPKVSCMSVLSVCTFHVVCI